MCFTQKLVFIVGKSATALEASNFPRTLFNLKCKTVSIKYAFQMFKFDSVTLLESILFKQGNALPMDISVIFHELLRILSFAFGGL